MNENNINAIQKIIGINNDIINGIIYQIKNNSILNAQNLSLIGQKQTKEQNLLKK